MLRLTLRLQRTGLIGMTAFGAFYGLFQSAAYKSAAGTTAAQRAAFGQQMAALGRSISYLLPLPVHVETVGGYLQWRVYGALPLLFAFFALMSAAGASRGDEERGLVEEWLSAGVGRVRYLAFRTLVFAGVAALAVAATSAAIDLGSVQIGSPLPLGPVVEQSIALLALTLVCYAVVLVAAQLTTSRVGATGLGGGVLLVVFLINGFSRTVDSLRPLASVVSPFYYYDRSTPLTPGGTFDAVATAGLLVAAAALAGLAAWLMVIRDVGAPLLRRTPRPGPTVRRPATNPLLRVPIVSRMYEQRIGLLAWGLSTALAAAYISSISRQTVDAIRGAPGFRGYLTVAGHGDPYAALTGFFWFGIFETVLAVYAITQVARWSSDDNEGRLEMVLSAPVSRSRVVGERALALLLATIGIIAVSSAVLYLGTQVENIHLRLGDLTAASVALVPFALSFAAVGAVLASRVPRATVAVLTTLAFVSYLVSEGGPLLKWPDWALKLSVFSLYDTPLTNGIYWPGFLSMLAIAVVGFGLAALLMQRRDVGR